MTQMKMAGIPASGLRTRSGAVNVASVPHRSPLRYPGGKTWLVPEIRGWLSAAPGPIETFVEPFAGGATASLTAVMEGFAQRAVICEKDSDLVRLWRVILNASDELCQMILSFEPSRDNVLELLSRDGDDEVGRAFQVLVRNRVTRGGILAKGASLMKSGENGQGVASRWYPGTLIKRIKRIRQYSDRLDVIEGDGLRLLEHRRHDARAAFFIDPPYTAAGKRAGRRLYTHNQIDHAALFDLVAEVQGSFLMTYDESSEIEAMAEAHRFLIRRIPMKNTHHAIMHELLITKGIAT